MWMCAPITAGLDALFEPSVLQAAPVGRGLLAFLVTFVVATLFYAITLHLAATFFIGSVPTQRAASVAPAPAAVSILLGRYGLESVGFVSRTLGILIVIVATLVADALAISRVYDLDVAPTLALVALHFGFAAVLGIALVNLFGLL